MEFVRVNMFFFWFLDLLGIFEMFFISVKFQLLVSGIRHIWYPAMNMEI